MAEWVHPTPSSKEHALLALHRYKKYKRSPNPAHELGGLFISCSERTGAPYARVCVRRPQPGWLLSVLESGDPTAPSSGELLAGYADF
jgi:hypothetical protein